MDRPILSYSDGIHVIGPLPVGEEDRAVVGHASAKHVGVDDKTVAGWRAKIAPTVEIQQSTKCEGADDGRRQALTGDCHQREGIVPGRLDPSITGPIAVALGATGCTEAPEVGADELQHNRRAHWSRSRHDRLLPQQALPDL